MVHEEVLIHDAALKRSGASASPAQPASSVAALLIEPPEDTLQCLAHTLNYESAEWPLDLMTLYE